MANQAPRPLAAPEIEAIRRIVSDQAPRFAHRAAPGAPIQGQWIQQPYFRRHRIVEVGSPVPLPAMRVHGVQSSDGTFMILTGHLDHLREVARAEPPEAITDPESARGYANAVDFWTTENDLGDLLVSSFDEIPWRKNLTESDQRRIAALQSSLGAQIEPPTVQSGAQGVTVTKWVLANQRLLRRQLVVPGDGQVTRTDQVIAEDLPAPSGKLWGFVKGRLVPTG